MTATDGASATFIVPRSAKPQTYSVLVRYEAPYRFEVPFQLVITQGGQKKYTRVYGRRSSLKVCCDVKFDESPNSTTRLAGLGLSVFTESGFAVWARSSNGVRLALGSNRKHGRSALESTCIALLLNALVWQVWEGVNSTVSGLEPGKPAEISLTPVHDSDYCCWGDRNIDAVLLHPNASDVDRRLVDEIDGQVLPIDGLFSQRNEVFFKVRQGVHLC